MHQSVISTKHDNSRHEVSSLSYAHKIHDVRVATGGDYSASPEVISNLITSLAIISEPANHHFNHFPENIAPPYTSNSPDNSQTSTTTCQQGSFGRDYGAFSTPSEHNKYNRNADASSLDDLAALPPTIRTSKPPSGYSIHTVSESQVKSPTRRLSFRRSHSSSSISTSRSDTGTGHSLHPIVVEPVVSDKQTELKRRPSVESWGKKQARKHKGLMYMTSKERLRDSEHSRVNSALATDQSESRSHCLMAETSIEEEATMLDTIEPSQIRLGSIDSDYDKYQPQPIIESPQLLSIGDGMFIPIRQSSLRKKANLTTKHSSLRASRRNGEVVRTTSIDEVSEPQEENDHQKQVQRERRTSKTLEQVAKLQEPLEIPPPDISLASRPRTADAIQDWRTHSRQNKPLPHTPRDRHSEGLAYERIANMHRMDNSIASDTITKPSHLSAPVMNRAVSVIDSKPIRASKISMKSANMSESVQLPDERPSTSDSIDDSVDAYLCSPRLSQKIRHPQTGRVISFSEVGDSDGHAVFVCVGMGLTRYITAFYDELALTLRLRLITPDRPGVGESEAYTDGTSTPLSWPDDIYAICQALKITKFSILAHSAGAIYALATALRMPQHIRGKIHLLAPWIPPSQLSVIGGQQVSPPTNSIPTSQRILRALPAPILRVANSSFMNVTSASVTTSLPRSHKKGGKRKSGGSVFNMKDRSSTQPPPDNKENRISTPTPPSSSHDPDVEENIPQVSSSLHPSDSARQLAYDTRLTHAIWDLATRNANPAIDLLICLERHHSIGFRYVDITRQVVIHHGTKDSRVPVQNVKWLGGSMRNCEVRILEGEGHGLMASAGVMGGVLWEIGKEWEAWEEAVKQARNSSGNSVSGGEFI